MCGGTDITPAASDGVNGLSPRVRGNRLRMRERRPMPGSIPACAGEPDQVNAVVYLVEVYPRVCGGTAANGVAGRWIDGLSPRVRGNRRLLSLHSSFFRSIPACAGEPLPPAEEMEYSRVYPRVCGGTGEPSFGYPLTLGLSPRVRGNPWVCRRLAQRGRVYPRVCGGTLESFHPRRGNGSLLMGLSPRVRGNRPRGGLHGVSERSIPACAGEPDTSAPSWTRMGLSPRVRGNPFFLTPSTSPKRSIPACAGEPPAASQSTVIMEVYPRVCGGTCRSASSLRSLSGLSPRVRGNPLPAAYPFAVLRSIPACAGEPPASRVSVCRSEVYPRVCGGTNLAQSARYGGCGLSPRVRGNHDHGIRYQLIGRSIPACAGEPSSKKRRI